MKKLLSFLLCLMILGMQSGAALAITEVAQKAKAPIYKTNARTIKYAFVFDGPSDKNAKVLKQFQTEITKSTAPDYKAEFPKNLVFEGNWTSDSVKDVSQKALSSDATMVVSLGYLSSKYFSQLQNKKKMVVTIDQYGLRDFGDGLFNPLQQSIKGALLFKKLISFNKAAVLMTESYYKTQKDWNKFLESKLPGLNFTVVPVNGGAAAVLGKIPSDCDAVIFTPLYNMSSDQKEILISNFNSKKMPTYSTVGKEDVEAGVLFGTGAYDLDRKMAEATSFSIQGVLNGNKAFTGKVDFYEDELLYFNKDTAELLNYQPHLRVLNNAEVITNKAPKVYSLTAVFDTLDKQNLDIERKRLLVKAARRASAAAILKYLPSFGITLGYQQYNEDFARSAQLSVPEKTGVFSMGIEQIIYSPALVTNILVKGKMVNFQKAEQLLTEQNMGIDIALMYLDILMLENAIKVQKDYVKESRENLAIARVREKLGKCGYEEPLRWASQLSINEQHLLDMTAELKNLKIAVNKLLTSDQKENFELAELKANDPAFYTSEIHIINYVSTPVMLEKFTQMLIEESYRVSPELAKLKAAIKMKDHEMSMYYQKFILPDAKLSLDYTSLLDRQFTGTTQILQPLGPGGKHIPVNMNPPNATNGRLGIFAQWKPIEGGTKIAEIARIKAEREELQRYSDEVKITLEAHIREVINKALAGYFSIEKNYKAMYASQENYHLVKNKYLKGSIPIAQMVDAQHTYLDSKVKAMNSQYIFFKELLWVQRGICSVNWSKATPEAKQFIQKLKDNLESRPDIQLL
ncbi:MAG: TolC family protein [Candidatus Gastranaerophilales bacterium]|nr:TolC family protein [Candidatus Gastranaerophilales bacterium]